METGIYYHIPTYSNYTSDVPEGGQVDFQVQVLVGHATQRWVSRSPFATTVGGYDVDAVAFDVASDWSSTQTVKIGDGSDSASSSENGATPTPSADANPQKAADSIPLTTFAIVVVAFVAIIAGLTVMMLRRQKR